ncbi:MAG: SUMF1/EgtB/PvdO family nonheme iron enzyme [Moorea sp. SIO4G2]|nr:SUMF1/EgtB/PvdO family nonheme iron enzyme [Moorena sp. SIO4G2]
MNWCINPDCSKPYNTEDTRFCQACGSELLLAERYRVIGLLSDKGAFGKTYEVLDHNSDQKSNHNTLKVLKVLTDYQSRAVELFEQEPWVLSQLNHPGIPKSEGTFIFSCRNNEINLHCMVLEYIEGLDLEEYQHQHKKHPIDETLALEWLSQLVKILHVVHQKHFFHRDKGDHLPVEQICWYDAVEFCARVSQKTGRTYRLPSEVEWEYACRAGITTKFYFGQTITTNLANYDGHQTDTDGSQPKGIFREKTTTVGSFQVANAFGLYDMHGNVWEWCADHWHENHQGAPSDGSAWLSKNEDRDRLLRGGSWLNSSGYCHSDYRNFNAPDVTYISFGFRVVCDLI